MGTLSCDQLVVSAAGDNGGGEARRWGAGVKDQGKGEEMQSLCGATAARVPLPLAHGT